MNIGMLWFDNNTKKSLSERVHSAADYYKAKYGAQATVCFVNPRDIPQDFNPEGNPVIKGDDSILPKHFWLGVAE